MANFPQELINEVLLWLSVKSLLRFKCVSKSFCGVIGSQSFINSHFQRSSGNGIHRKLIDLGVRPMDDNRRKLHALEFSDEFQQEVVLDKFFSSKLDHYFFSYCNGLVLLFLDKLSLWNPSTRKYRVLPAIPVKHNRNLNFALGYDSTTDDYKALVIISKKGGRGPSEHYFEVWIFELRSSCWRRIQDFPYVDYIIEAGSSGDCFLDGAVHFTCYHKDERESYIIVAFDVAKESFSVVSGPVLRTEGFPIRLHVFGGCLSISLLSCGWGHKVEIYVRKKDGDAFTWTRLYFVIAPLVTEEVFPCFIEGRLAYSKEGEKVFIASDEILCSYDTKKMRLQEIATKNNTVFLDLFYCTESLASIDS